jgi:hypothetical protein
MYYEEKEIGYEGKKNVPQEKSAPDCKKINCAGCEKETCGKENENG